MRFFRHDRGVEGEVDVEFDEAELRVTLSIPPAENPPTEELELTPFDSTVVAEKPQLASDPVVELTVYREESAEEDWESPAFSPPPRPDDASKERLRYCVMVNSTIVER